MKMKHLSIMAAVVVSSLGVTSAHAIQKRDPIFQNHTVSHIKDPDLLRRVRYQNGSPRSKPDLYVAPAGSGSTADRDLLSEIRNQNGSPRSKH
jgi:hypothetical protein